MTSLCRASSVCMLWTWCYQFLLLCAGAPATWRPQLSMSLARRVLSRNSPAAIATVDRWDRRTDARPLDPAPHTTHAASVIILLQWHSHTSGVRGVRPPPVRKLHNFWYVRERVYFPYSKNTWTSTQQKCKIRRVARKALGPSKLATHVISQCYRPTCKT